MRPRDFTRSTCDLYLEDMRPRLGSLARMKARSMRMNRWLGFSILAWGFASLAACSSAKDSPSPADAGSEAPGDAGPEATSDTGPEAPADAAELAPDGQALSTETVLDLDDLKTNPTPYDWFDFKPNVKKLILAGAPETQHVAILWYTIEDGGVGLHYHSKTESVYVIDGTQTDAKGVYPTGTVYFNPPGSGHEITHSTGFFVLAYASPPDFANTDLIGEYTPVRIDTGAPDLTSLYPFEDITTGVRVYAAPLDSTGGMSAAFIETTSSGDYVYRGNYVLVLKGSCDIEGVPFTKDKMVVGKTVEPRPYKIAASKDSSCLALGVSF
jgi:ChrR Cupin-like domain